MREAESGHDPVMLTEVLAALRPAAGQTIVDCTLGRGGHGLAIAKLLAPGGTLIGLDADARNLSFAQERIKAELGIDAGAADGKAAESARVRLFHANFSQLAEVLEAAGVSRVDGLLADLGISTNQLFDPGYGMSFDRPGPLDMRLDPESGPSAAEIVNSWPEERLANVLYELAQERYSRRIARKIVEARRSCPITDTEALAALVRSAIPHRGGPPDRIDPATRTFMALRMVVNREMENLAALLQQGPKTLRPGARLAVISFHSMEDRAVKQAFRSLEQTGVVTMITKKPLAPSADELTRNPRARSAKLRVVEARHIEK